MYELALLQRDGTEQIVPVSGEVIVMGRASDCDIVINDYNVSRRHAKVVIDHLCCRLVDLGSKNGTQVNGNRFRETLLKEGDQILLGSSRILFRKTLDKKVVLDEQIASLEDPGTIIRSVTDLSKYFLRKFTPPDGSISRSLSEQKDAGTTSELGRVNLVLRSLSGLAKTLISTTPEEVPDRVMDAVFEHIPGDRGFLMLYDDKRNLKPKVVRYRNNDNGQITISKTIADKVTKDRVAILTSDAQVDPRFSKGESVWFHGIRSALCAPLWKGDDVIGIIHVDSPIQTKTFSTEDLELLSVLSNYAAIAIQQANLNQKVQEEKACRERLEKYFSPNVANRILSEGEQEVQEVEVSVLFADIVGFTQLAEQMRPQSVAELLNEFFSRMEEPIFQHEGTLDKFIGDCIMAVFGAPYQYEDHAARAVKVAIEMRRRLHVLNEELKEKPLIQMRMGIYSGKAVSGPIGSKKRREFTVLGDTVNVASRIEANVAKEGQIIIGDQTFELVKGLFEARDLGVVSLKGKTKQLRLYEILSEKIH